MEFNNGKDRTTKEGRSASHDIGDTKTTPGIMGTIQDHSAQTGTYAIEIGGKNRLGGNTAFGRRQSFERIAGKFAGQLINEAEKQLAYHEQQVSLLKERIHELREFSDLASDVTKFDNRE